MKIFLSPVNQKGLFIKRYIVDKPKAEIIRLEEQSEKAESCWENLINEIQVNGP